MQFSILAIVASLSAGVAARECKFTLSYYLTQNPVGGGDNTNGCSADIDYSDGRNDRLNNECNFTSRNNCYNSALPNRICIHTNSKNEDGYLDYGSQHKDFNEDGCKQDSWSNPTGHGHSVACTFECE